MEPTQEKEQKYNPQNEDSYESGQEIVSDLSDEEENTTSQKIESRQNDSPSSNDDDSRKEPKQTQTTEQQPKLFIETKKQILNQPSKISQKSYEIKEKQSTETKSEPTKEEPIKEKKSRRQKPERSDKKQKKIEDEKLRSQQKENLQSFDEEWDPKQIESDQGESLNSDKDEAEQQNEEKTAVFEEEDVNNLSVINQEDQMNNAYIERETNIKYQHWIENKHLIVLYLLFRTEIYELFPKKLYNRIDIHPANKNKIKIFGITQEEIKQISSQISSIINKIAILKLNIRNDEALRLKSSKLLNKKLLKDKMVIFKFGNPGDKSYYLGGKGTQPQLACVFKDIRNLKFRYFRMFDYPNTRSYKIILGNVIRQKDFLKAFSKWNLKNLEIVPYIPNFSSTSSRRQEEKSLCFLMTTVGNFDNFSPKQIQNNLAPFIKNNFYSIILIFRKGDKYLPKLSVEGIFFKYVSERKLPWSYVYIMCLKKNFFEKREAIIAQIEKLAGRRIIFGARFFNHISPQRSEYIKPEIYKEVKFPEDRPAYSYSIIARQIKPQVQFQSKEQNSEIKEREVEPKKYYSFDWKQHLMNFHSTETSFMQEAK